MYQLFIIRCTSLLYECLFNVSFTSALCDSLFCKAPNLGIEIISAEVYKYICEHMDYITENDKYCLYNTIKTSAIF